MNQLLMGIKEAATALALSPWTLRSYVRQGRLAAVRIGKRILIEPAELERLVREGRNGAERHGTVSNN